MGNPQDYLYDTHSLYASSKYIYLARSIIHPSKSSQLNLDVRRLDVLGKAARGALGISSFLFPKAFILLKG